MKFPKFMRVINKTLAIIAGGMIFTMGILAVVEVISRSFFKAPTVWSVDIESYLLIWAVFLGQGYAFQEKGHVGVDLVRDIVEKRFGKMPRRAMAIIGYVISLAVVIALLRAGLILAQTAVSLNQLTLAFIQIPAIYLYAAIVIGSIAMVVTVVLVILDLFSKEEKYL